MEPLLKHQFDMFKSSFEIDTATSLSIVSGNAQEESRRESAAFEKFVNYIMFSIDDPDIFTADEELLDLVSIGGANDTGIDGIGIKVNDRLVRSREEVTEIVQSSRKVRVEFVFIQSKMSTAVDSAGFTKFGTGVKNFFSQGYLPENEHIKELRDVKDFIYSDRDVISKLDTNPSLFVYYVTAGAEPQDDHFAGLVRMLETDLVKAEFHFEAVAIATVGGKQLIKYCRELQNKFEVQLSVVDIVPLIVAKEAEIKKAYVFTCAASEFLKLLRKEDGQIRRSLFNENVRDYLGNKGAVNREIERTIREQPEMFLLRNNGITIVCDDFEQVRDKLVKIENPQIVNGCQTSNCLFNYRDDSMLGGVQVLVRVISTENVEISNSIVRGTNKQNLVLDEAFEATRPFHQDVLEPFFFAMAKPSTKLYYERRAKQYNDDPLIKKTEIVNLRILTQTFVALFLESPHEAHRHEAKLLELYAGEDLKRKIFCDVHGAYPYYACAMIWFMLESYFRHERLLRHFWPYKAHLCLLLKYTLGQHPVPLNGSKASQNYCKDLLAITQEPVFAQHVQCAVDCFEETVNIWLRSGRSRFGMKDSKDFTDQLLRQARSRFIEGEPLVTSEDHRPTEKDEMSSATSETSGLTHEGEILDIIWRDGRWFAFIKGGRFDENIYFDARAFVGDPLTLARGSRVTYEASFGQRGPYAATVKLASGDSGVSGTE